MNPEKIKKPFEDMKVNVKIKIAALWTAIMFCYIYNDYFSLFKSGVIEELISGQMGPFHASQGALLIAAAMMAIPAIMIFLSLILKPKLNRWANIILGVFYTALMVVSMQGEWAFYIFMGVIEIILTLLIVFLAIKWPKQAVN